MIIIFFIYIEIPKNKVFLIIKLTSLFFIRVSVNNFSLSSNWVKFVIGHFNSWIFEIHYCALLEEMCEVFILIFWVVVFNKLIEYVDVPYHIIYLLRTM